jgi:NADH dehydrogenase
LSAAILNRMPKRRGQPGTELAAELHHAACAIIAYGLDKIDPEHDLRIVLIEAADRVLPGLLEWISASTQELLVKLGVEVRTKARGEGHGR